VNIVILGPTASGKTRIAYDIAKKYNGILISADSRQVYKYLDIGSNKERFTDIPTYLIDLITPDHRYNAYQFKIDAQKVIKENKEKLIVIVGGTYLYIKSLIYNLQLGDKPNIEQRKKLENKDITYIQNLLKQKAPQFFTKINNSDLNNKRRLIRYLEIDLNNMGRTPKIENGDILIQNNISKEDIITNIQSRTKMMMQKGLIDECKKVLSIGYSKNDPGLQMIGYKETIEYIEGKIHNIEDLEEKINKSTIKLAKKQITFLKQDKNVIHIPSNEIIQTVDKYIGKP
jgi:tRNA dimethylallyltransferase